MAKIALIVVSILATLFVNGINCKDDEERDKVRLRVNALAIAQLERHIESSEVKLRPRSSLMLSIVLRNSKVTLFTPSFK